jgi:ribose transport system substrate-binding protein
MEMTNRMMRLTIAAALCTGAFVPAYAADSYGFSNVGLSFPFAAAIAKGFQDAAKEASVTAIVLDAKNDVQKQANDIDDLIAQKVKGIVIMPLDSTVAQGWVDKIAAAGIPVASVGSQIGDPSKRAIKDVYPKLVAVVTQDEIAAGNRAGELALTLLPKDRAAKIAVIEGQAGFSEVKQRSQGFLEALDKAGAKYQIVASQPGDWTAEKGEAACQNILSAHPDVDLFFNQADDMVVGCARAVKAASSKAKLIGFGGSKLAIAAIKDGSVDGTVCYKPEELGKLAFQAVYEAASGKKTREHEFITYNTPGVSKVNIDQCVGQW